MDSKPFEKSSTGLQVGDVANPARAKAAAGAKGTSPVSPFRWAPLIWLFVAGMAAWGIWYANGGARENQMAEIPTAKFAAITAEAGITFVHNNGAYGEKLLPETMGGGVAFLDFDNNGTQDLLFINSTWWPGHIPQGKQPRTMALYRNDGTGHFTDVSAGSGLDVSLYGMGVAIGDYDNDGLPDVFITALGGNR